MLYRQDNRKLLEWLLCALVPIVLLSRVAHKAIHSTATSVLGVGLANLRLRCVKTLWFRIVFYDHYIQYDCCVLFVSRTSTRSNRCDGNTPSNMDSVYLWEIVTFVSVTHHFDVRMRILECPPPLKGESLETYTWEAREF